jgi:hypothetical protein
MKLMIDIPEREYERFKKNQKKEYSESMLDVNIIANGTPIPDNATNGDVVQMIFPYYSYERNDYVQSTEDYIVDSMECMEHDLYFAYDWWNAPYKKGGK